MKNNNIKSVGNSNLHIANVLPVNDHTLVKDAHDVKLLRLAWEKACETGDMTDWYHLHGVPTAAAGLYNEYITKSGTYQATQYQTKETPEITPYNFTEELVKSYNTEKLFGLKNTELRDICVKFGLKKSGKKSELVHTINEYISDFGYMLITAAGNMTIDEQIQFVFSHKIHVSIARHIVKKTAGTANSQQNGSCMDIVNSGFQDTMFEDICQGIAEQLLVMFRNHDCELTADGRIKYREIEKEDGTTGTTYINLYKAMRKVLSDAKADNRSMASGLDSVMGYHADNLIDILETRENFTSFFKFLKKTDAKNYSDYLMIIQAVFEDSHTDMELSEITGLKVRKIKYLRGKLFDYAKQFMYPHVTAHNITYLQYADKKNSVIVKLTHSGKYASVVTGDVIDTEKMYHTPKKGLKVTKRLYVGA